MHNIALDNFPIDYTIVSEAAASLSKEGEILATGRSMTRLKLGPDSRFYVAATVIKSRFEVIGYIIGKIGTFLNFYAEMKNGNETIFVNINSISKRLLVSKTKIQEAAINGTLPLLLNQRAERAASIVSGYEKIVQIFKDKISLSPQALMKEIRTTVKEELFYKELTIQGQTYQLGFDSDKKEIELMTLNPVFRTGTFGKIRTITNVFNHLTEVLKQAKSDSDINIRAKADIKNEHDQLKAVHAKGRVWGVQAPPRRLIQIKEGLTEQYGHIGLKYDEDYFDTVVNTPGTAFKDRLIDFHQILSGAKVLADQNFLHGDLKLENILIKNDIDGIRLVHLADLGGACFVPDAPPADLTKFAGGNRSFTPTTSSLDDLLLGKKLAAEGKFDELVELEKKRDVFSIGCILHMAITGSEPFHSQNTAYGEFPDVSYYIKIVDSSVPKEIKNLIKEMLDPDHTKRPTAQEAFAVYDNFLKFKYPAIHQQIQAKIQKEYPGSVS